MSKVAQRHFYHSRRKNTVARGQRLDRVLHRNRLGVLAFLLSAIEEYSEAPDILEGSGASSISRQATAAGSGVRALPYSPARRRSRCTQCWTRFLGRLSAAAIGYCTRLTTDPRTAREFFHTVGDNRSQLHHLLAQFGVFRNVALNAIAIGLQFSPQCLKFTDEM